MSTQSESIGVYVPVSELVPWDQNPRLNESAVQEVAKSIKRFGFASPIIARTADNMVIAGHTRLLAAKKIGLKSVPVRFMDLDLNDAQLLALADNKIGEIADWEETKLKDILASLDDQDLSGLGWSDDELDALIDHHEPVELNGDPDHVPEVQELAITSAGDLWLLGDHRLLCGNSTSGADVERLMDGLKADVVLTDPPYNLQGNGKRFHTNKAENALDGEDFGSWDLTFDPLPMLDLISEHTKKNSHLFVFTSDYLFGSIFDYFVSSENHDPSYLVWCKNNPMPSMQKIRPVQSTELIVHSRKGKPVFNYPVEGNLNNYILGNVESHSTGHPAQKPLYILEEILSWTNGSVIDLFGGSGSTLIACEKAGRKSYHMELDPKYCDVIIRRWQDLTGKEAVKENGIKFNDITDIPW